VEGVRRLAAASGLLLLSACGDGSRVEYDGPFAADVRSAMAKIERITGTPFKAPPRVATRARSELRAILEREFEDKDASSVEFETRALRLFGVVPASLDLRELILDLLVEQVTGFYLPGDSTLYLLDDAPAMVREFLITHELVHALQAQYLNLDSIQRIEGNDDRQMAAQSMLEGHAQFVAMRASGAFASIEQQRTAIRRGQSEMPKFASAPLFVQEVLIFPYLSGNEFVRHFLDSLPGESLYEPGAVPVSTEQVLHWSRYAGERDAPTRITLPPPRIGTAEYDNDLGEFGTRLMLFVHARNQASALAGAEGWDGDRYALLRTPRGDGIVWLTIWDSTVEAAEFGTAMRLAIDRRYYEPASTRLSDGSTEFSTGERTLRLWGGEIDGRAAVLYVDVPAGERTDLLDLSAVVLSEADRSQ
jgi:hypothetical protein